MAVLKYCALLVVLLAALATVQGRICPSGTWWRPAPTTTWQWQLTGTVNTTFEVQMYDIDLFEATSTLVSTLHSKGRVVICYFSTQYENWRPDASQFPAADIGNPLDGWAGETWVNIKSTTIRNIMAARMDRAVSIGCDGVEPDNVDGYTHSNGFGQTAADQLDYNKFIANTAHAKGLSVGLKNDLDQVSSLLPYFDWALNEQCNEYSECSTLRPFITAGKAVFNCEYKATSCTTMLNYKFSTIVKGLNLGAPVKSTCCPTGGCPKANYTCVSSAAKRSLPENEAVPEVGAAATIIAN